MNKKSNLFKTEKSWTRYLILLFLLIVTTQISARNEWSNANRYFQAWFDNYKGCVVIVFRQGDDEFGPANENGYIEKAEVKFNGSTIFRLSATDVNTNYTLAPESGTTIQTYRDWSYNDDTHDIHGGHECYYVAVEWYSSTPLSPGNSNVSINGTWDVNGVYGTDAMSASRTVSIPSLGGISINSVSIDTKANQTSFTYTKNGTSGMDTNGNFKLYSGSEEITTIGNIQNGKFTISGISESAKSYTLKYTFAPNGNENAAFSTSSASYKVPGYTRPKNLAATFNDVTRTVELTWDIPTIGGTKGTDYRTEGFQLQRCEKGNTTWTNIATDIEYDNSKNRYTYSDETFKNQSVSKTFTYRLRRKANTTDHWDVTTDLYLSTEHADINPSTIKAELDDNNKYKVHVTWKTINAEKLWSTGSKFLIARMNKTANTKEEITLKKEDFIKGEYVDSLINLCNIYYYMLQVIPGGNYSTNNAVATNTILSSEIGDMKSLTVSKGYFYDRVELKWEADFSEGGFDKFIIQRKQHDADDSEYQQIQMIDASPSITQYNTEDKNCVAGIIYDYKVYGVLKCAEGAPLQSKKQLTQIGFRTPTGDIYGRLTFESGQAVKDVEVRLETEDEIPGYSYALNGGYLKIDKTSYLSSNKDSITLQAWIKPNNVEDTKVQSIVKKENMYSFYIQSDKLYFKIGNTTNSQTIISDLQLSTYSASNPYIHVSATYSKDSLKLYINGECVKRAKYGNAANFTGTSSPVIFGEGFAGNIDEIRIWSKALDATSIARDYKRYLAGNENGLIGYYTFNYSTKNEFYDTSYKGANYNENHGTITGNVTLDAKNIPTHEQLGYKGITSADGSYTIHAVPYTGNGTSYSIIPRLGIHTFEPTQAVRIINSDAQNHTVNFTDKSSFDVQGIITYYNSTIPVEGVMFTIDGVTVVKSNGTLAQSGADGLFVISVPVGTHEVKAVKPNHIFVNEGKITNSNGTDRNYQDDISGIQLKDSTTIRYIGRVAGGTVQEAYPIGHSLSKNNLADGITVTLNYKDERYNVYSGEQADSTVAVKHFKPSNATEAHSNNVTFEKDKITIYPDPETGEFVADVFPIKFNANVKIPGHDDITLSGNNAEVDFSQSVIQKSSLYEYTDSVSMGEDQWKYTNYSDTVYYNHSQLFIGRYTPTIEITQLNSSKKEQEFFGDEKATFTSMDGTEREITLYKEGKYLIGGKPVFQQSGSYQFKTKIFEEFVYHGEGKKNGTVDRVPTQDATFTLTNELAVDEKGLPSSIATVTGDEKGEGIYKFQVGEPELTSGTKKITAKASYGDGGTSINWGDGITAIVIGSHQKGNDFITGGPDKILTVLRDPPGSKSYAYLEKGTSFKSASSFKAVAKQEGDDTAVEKLGFTITTFTGIGAGVISSVETDNGLTVGVHHEESYTGTSSQESTTTTTTKFQTSDDPLYVGANGDVYIGYSTNISYGMAEAVSIISKEDYEKAGSDESKYAVYEEITPIDDSDYLLVKQNALGAGMSFGTLFAYPQVYIEQTLLPKMEDLRNQFLQPDTKSEAEYQAEANSTGKAVYVSHLSKDDENYGKSNNDKVFTYNPPRTNLYDGKSYKIYFPEDKSFKAKSDTILYLNQSIDNWYKQLAANEKAKVNAKLLQNYSFHAGSPIEYSESYTAQNSMENEFTVILASSLETTVGGEASGTGVEFTIHEGISTEATTTSSDTEEKSQTKGFFLAEDGDDDYISVDVCREATEKKPGEEVEKDEYYSSFIFKTKGGATSCPFEGEYVTQYYEPGTVIDEATIQIEVPEVAVEKDFIENIPSGKSAYLTLYLRNNSEMQEDGWYNLKIVDGSNPDGAQLFIDGAAIGNGRAILVPAGETLVKTLEVRKGAVMNYDLLQLTLQSQCQCDPSDFLDNIADTVSFSVHFTPSCTDVNIKKPSNNWTYNTKLKTESIDGVDKHYMDVVLDGFDVNYDNFHSIRLQYKPTSGSDEDWTTLINYFNDETLYDEAIGQGLNAKMIAAADAGTINYKWFLDDMPDQRYDLRAVSICMINNVEVENISEVKSGIKDMYCPRLFGSAQPANGILTINDEIRLNFNETISDGLLTVNNFQVTGVRNGTKTDHSTSVRMDGVNDYFESQFSRNWNGKDITVEMWVLEDEPQDATFFSQGNKNESLEFGITADNKLKVKVGSTEIISKEAVPYDQGTWAHVAMVLDKDGHVSAYYNFVEYISNVQAEAYAGEGNFVFGRSIATEGNYYAGKMHNARIWDTILTSGRLQTNSLNLLSGTDNNLLAYYPMNEARGTVLEDKARGANLEMKGGEWVLPDGRAASFNGEQYLEMTTGSAVLTSSMDYTIEFWFRGEPGQTNATLVANGRGDGLDMGGSKNLFFIGFEDGDLTFRNNEVKATANGDYLDNNWHHFALAVNRTTGRAQILIDGNLNTYFEAQDLGGIAAAKTYLGARVWTSEEDITTTQKDYFFKGAIDDFRFWNLYKSESIVSESNNERLDGTEKGLLVYYPFEHYIEWQGTNELQFTLADKKVQEDPTQKIPDAVVYGGGSLETAETAPVKDKGPVANLLYDFVANDDALIINLNEPWEKVEKTIVTFTVDGVRDANGNEIVSPITWSAYIDRNQLKWSEDELNLEKKVNEPMTFDVQAQNLGGSIQHFTIENMPSWMDVTPTEGTINPKSNLNITFTVDEGLNIGSYDEVIYMRNDNNVSEALPINIKVNGEKPDWSVNPKDFKYSMNIYGKLRINNIFSIDKEDMLAAFSNGKCVGVANNQYLKVNDMWYAFLTVYNNDKNANLEFRIWDASTGKVYLATTTETIAFESDAVKGSAINPLIFDAKETMVQNVVIDGGWNWVSFNVATEALKSVQEILKNNEWAADDFVKDETNEKLVSYSTTDAKWVGTMNETGFDNKHMYLVKSSKAQTISVTGTPIKSKEGLTLELQQGWNYIGYIPNVNLTLKEALAGYEAQEGDIVKGQSGFSMFGGNLGWLGNLTYLEAGKGYMLHREGEATQLVYPSINGTTASRTRAMATEAPAYENKQYAQNMSVVAITNGTFEANDRILAYAGSELRGIAKAVKNPANDSTLYFININGEGSEPISFAVERKGEIIAKTGAEFDYSSNDVKGSIQKPYKLNFSNEEGMGSVYPNPFEHELNIKMSVKPEAVFEITINDISGRLVKRYEAQKATNGYIYKTLNDLEDLTSGFYMLNVKVDGVNNVYKVEKK
ncbi:LamG-like jellyroll fold domain-containing protein [Bacteroides sp.]